MRDLVISLLLLLSAAMNVTAQETPVFIETGSFSLIFTDWKLDQNYSKIEQHADSVFVYPELGETPEGLAFKLTSPSSIIKITQHYRTSLSISDEGPHLDLLDWRHHTSKTTALNDSKGYFRLIGYSPAERELFPSYTEKELTDYLKTNFPEWAKLLYENNKFTKNALSHSISEIYLTIFYTNDHSPEIQKKVIVFQLPLGC